MYFTCSGEWGLLSSICIQTLWPGEKSVSKCFHETQVSVCGRWYMASHGWLGGRDWEDWGGLL